MREEPPGLSVSAFIHGAHRENSIEAGEFVVRRAPFREVLHDDRAGCFFIALADGLVYCMVKEVPAKLLRSFVGQSDQFRKRFVVKIASIFRGELLTPGGGCRSDEFR